MRRRSLVLAALLLSSCATSSSSTSSSFLTDEVYAAHFTQAWAAYTAQTATDPPDRPTSRSREQRTLRIEIEAPIDEVFAVFSDVHQHFGLHPLLRHVVTHALVDIEEEDGDSDDDDGDGDGTARRERRFTAVEDVALGFGVVLPIETHAVMRIDRTHHRYTTESWTDPATITRQIFVFTDVGGGVTRIDETITFEAPLLLLRTAVDGGFGAHTRFMAAAKQRIEAR